MEIVKAFNSNQLHTEIVIKGTSEEPLFRASDIGTVLELSNIHASIKDFDETEKVINSVYTLGGNQQVTFLTEKGLYKVLFKSRKPIAEKFQNWICEIVKEIRLTGQYKLNKENQELQNKLEQTQQETVTIIHQNHLVNHNKFLQIYNNKKVVYVILLKNLIENGEKKNILKIGKTENLSRRIKEIAAEYMVKEPLIIDIFESNDILKLEYRIHNHAFVEKLHYKYTTNADKIATETYSVNDAELKNIKIIIKDLQDKLLSNEHEITITPEQIYYKELILKISEVELKNNEIKLKIIEKLSNSSVKNKIFEEIENEIVDELAEEYGDESENDDNKINIKPRKIMDIKIPKVYQYDPANLSTPIGEYNSPIELQRAKTNIVLNSLRNAIKNNTIYIGYRWVYVKRDETPPETITSTTNSVIKSHNEPTHLAQLNHTRTKILQVYSSAKSAIEAMEKHLHKELTCHSFNRAIKTEGLQFGFCWNYFNKCSTELQNEFLLHSSLPKYVNPLGKKIFKICSTTGNIIETFHSKVEVAKFCGISTKTVSKLLDTDEIHMGCKWVTKL